MAISHSAYLNHCKLTAGYCSVPGAGTPSPVRESTSVRPFEPILFHGTAQPTCDNALQSADSQPKDFSEVLTRSAAQGGLWRGLPFPSARGSPFTCSRSSPSSPEWL